MRKIKLIEFTPFNCFLILGIVMSTMLAAISSHFEGDLLDYIAYKSGDKFDIIMQLTKILIISSSAVVSSTILGQFLPLRLQIKQSMSFSNDVMRGILKLPYSLYYKNENGYYLNLVTSSAFTCGDLYTHLNIELIGNAICVIALLLLANAVNHYFIGIYVAYIIVFLLLASKPNMMISDYQKRGLHTQDSFLSFTKKIVESKKTINIIRAEEAFLFKYREKSEDYRKFITKYRLFEIIANNTPRLLSVILSTSILGLSVKLYFDSKMTIGSVFFIYQLSNILQTPLNRCIEIMIHYVINEVHLTRISEFYDSENYEDKFEKIYKDSQYVIAIEKGKFYSSPSHEKLLFKITEPFKISKNKFVVIKGKNGVGKSTIFNYITANSDIDKFEGKIEVCRQIKKSSYLSYPIILVDGNLEDNMFGVPIDNEALNALNISFEQKHISSSIENLSMGEQQKLNLLRVLSYPSEVLLLDEPFTNLDKATIESLVKYLEKIKGKKTIIVIMHSNELDHIADEKWTISDNRLEKAANML